MRALGLIVSFLITATSLYAADPVKTLSRKLMEGVKKSPKISLAVLNFPYAKGRMSTGSYLVSERLVTYMVKDGAVIVERRLLEKVLEERKLWESGTIDIGSLKKMGNVSAVDAVVVGTLEDLSDDETSVMARVIHLSSARVLSAASAVLPRLWHDAPRVPAIQSWAPVPMAGSAIGFTEKKSLPKSTRRRVPESEQKLNSRTYHPAPVPFYAPPTPKGGNNPS